MIRFASHMRGHFLLIEAPYVRWYWGTVAPLPFISFNIWCSTLLIWMETRTEETDRGEDPHDFFFCFTKLPCQDASQVPSSFPLHRPAHSYSPTPYIKQCIYANELSLDMNPVGDKWVVRVRIHGVNCQPLSWLIPLISSSSLMDPQLSSSLSHPGQHTQSGRPL